MLKEKYISEAQMKEEPKSKLALKIKEGSITPEHFNKREVENYLLTVVDSIESSGMLPEDKAKLDALPTASELQSTLNGKANSSDVYTKSEVYTQTEVDSLLSNLNGEYYPE